MTNFHKSKFVRACLLVVLGVVVALCAGYLLNVFAIQPAQTTADLRELNRIITEPIPASSGSHSMAVPDTRTKFQRLQAVNPDIKGWITVPGTGINYPVLQSSKQNPDYYLHRNYKRQYRDAGSIYLQYDCNPETSRNAILYGHHMIDRSMFTRLTRYNRLNFWQGHQSFSYEDASGKHSYTIFAVLHVSPDSFPFNRTQFADNADYARFLSALRGKSIYSTGVKVTDKDQIMMLVTCSYGQHNERTVIICKLNSWKKVLPNVD